MKRLALMRHAKSSWKDVELADYERPLNTRGLRDAPRMGERLHDAGWRADLIMTSPARRAAVTARTIAECIGYPLIDIAEEPALYLAEPATILDIARGIDDGHTTAMLFGHNPGMTQLANSLGDLRIDNMPTTAVAVFEFAVDRWREIDYGDGRLLLFDYPKNTAKP